MANEITLTAGLSCFKPSAMSAAVGRSVASLLVTMAGSTFTEGSLTVTTSPTAVPLGGVLTPGWFFCYNADATNFLRLMNGAGGAKVVKVKPLEFALFRWDDTGTPYAVADANSVLMEYLLVSP